MKLVIGHDVQLADAAGDHVWEAQNVQPDKSSFPAAALK
jgi:hypothetical protein